MAAIPEKKHDRQELQNLRMRNAMAVRPPVQQLQKQAAGRLMLGLSYAFSLFGAAMVIRAIHPYGPIIELPFMIGIVSAGLGLCAALLIFWRKPRSRHHASILAIISLLVLVFGSVYYIEQFEQSAHDDAQGPTRY